MKITKILFKIVSLPIALPIMIMFYFIGIIKIKDTFFKDLLTSIIE